MTTIHSEESLDDVIEDAVADGLGLCEELEQVVLTALERAAGAADAAVAEHGERRGREVLVAYQLLLLRARTDAMERFGRQHERLRTFNIVLFGRTGAGKSSLIEALSGGHGEPISQGESDWTVDVRDVRWASCRLYDTPGIGGWGRSVKREELERRAEAAVADADVVVLCFDTQSQQEGEFTKVADWVTAYGKPAVAVLNSRNGRWRFPARVKSEHARRQLSRSVHEHASNIRDELARVDMPDVPVVALHAKRGAFARTADPYAGPDANSRQKLRENFGPAQLLDWSNLLAFERLLSEALRAHAADLRLGMLREQARGVLEATLAQLRDEHRAAALAAAEQVERGIEDVLRVLGRPADRAFGQRIGLLEALRGGGFDVSVDGQGEQHARMRLAAELRAPRQAALRRAERLVDGAFAARREVDDKEFRRSVTDPAVTEVERIAEALEAEVRSFLEQRLALVADDVQADLKAALAPYGGARGSAGRDARRLGIGLEVGSALTTIGTGAYVAVALANSWNPIGWTLGAVAVGGAIAGWFGRRKRKAAEHQREAARSSARASARKAVNDTFEELEAELTRQFGAVFSAAAVGRLSEEVEQAIAVRRLIAAADTGEDALSDALEAVPPSRSSAHVLADVARDVQRRTFPGDAAADRLLWLGESWCTDPTGLEETGVPATVRRAAGLDPRRRKSLTKRLRAFVRRGSSRPAPGDGTAWLTETDTALADDQEAREALVEVHALVERGRPRLVVVGDYNAGKSSFIKRLLLDAGLTPPDELSVAARPETATATTYAWEGWDVVDTPGFQSADPAHGARAQAALDTASMVLVLFNPNLVVGNPAHLRVLLKGDDHRASKSSRTVFLINRADELGVDPHDDLHAYEQLCDRKELELRQALGSLRPGGQADVRDDQVLCVASDPYGMVGDRRDATSADYDPHRGWDGLDAFHRVVRELTEDHAANGVDIAVLGGGTAALGTLVAARRAELADLRAQSDQQRRLLLDIHACLNAGIALRDGAGDRLASALVDVVADLYDEAVATTVAATRAERVAKLDSWTDQPEVTQRYEEWLRRTERELDAWQRAASERVERRLRSAAFRAAFPDIRDAIDTKHLQPEHGAPRSKARKAGDMGANVAATAGRETVYGLAKRFGHKFRPWGAVKLTNKVNVAGAAVGVVLGAWDLRGIVKGLKAEQADEEAAHRARAETLRLVREAAEASFSAEDGAGAGIDLSLAVVGEVLASAQQTADELEERSQELSARIDRCEQRLVEARRRA